MPRLLLTRPLEDSKVFAAQLRSLSIDSLIAPMLTITALPHSLPPKPDGLIVTSRHALAACPQEWKDLPLYLVGGATAEAAGQKGFTYIAAIAASAEELEKILPRSPLLYLSAEHISHVFPTAERLVVYRAQAADTIDPTVQHSLKERKLDGVVFFSLRTASLFQALMEKDGLEPTLGALTAFCMSRPIAEQCLEYGGYKTVIHAGHPDRKALAGIIKQHYKTSG